LHEHSFVPRGKMPAFQHHLLFIFLCSIHGTKLIARLEKTYADLADCFAAIVVPATKEWCSPIAVEPAPDFAATMRPMNEPTAADIAGKARSK